MVMDIVENTLKPFPEHTHPYSVKIKFTLGSNIDLLMDEKEVHFPFAGNHIIKFVQEHTDDVDKANHIRRFSVHLEAFATKNEAEKAGKMLVFALFWFAASRKVILTIEYMHGEPHFSLIDRTKDAGSFPLFQGGFRIRTHKNVTPKELKSIVEEAYTNDSVSPKLLISMELFAAARLEVSERARFINVVTALEALSEQIVYDDDIALLLDDLARQLEKSSKLAGEDKSSIRNSLSGSLKNLRNESVRLSIKRIIREHSDNKEWISFIDNAYKIRSKILHEGEHHANLDSITHKLEDIIRKIYSSMLGLSLSFEPKHLSAIKL